MLLRLTFPFIFALSITASPDQKINPTPSNTEKSVVITMDDLPGAEFGSDDSLGAINDLSRRNRATVRVFRAHHVPALGLVNEFKVQVAGERDARSAILEDWNSAELELGNHTYSHLHFNETTLQAYEDDTVRGEVVTAQILKARGKQERYFRHTALQTGRTPEEQRTFDAFLVDRGYQVAPVSLYIGDVRFNDVMGDALSRGDLTTAQISREAYVRHALRMFDYAAEVSKGLFHREIPQIVLVHDNQINSEMMDDLLTRLEQRGYRFVSLDEALRDPAYGSRESFKGNLDRCYLCWDDRFRAVGKTLPPPPDLPEWVNKRFHEIRGK